MQRRHAGRPRSHLRLALMQAWQDLRLGGGLARSIAESEFIAGVSGGGVGGDTQSYDMLRKQGTIAVVSGGCLMPSLAKPGFLVNVNWIDNSFTSQSHQEPVPSENQGNKLSRCASTMWPASFGCSSVLV